MRHIDSPQNPEIKRLATLKDKRGRLKEGQFLVEGTREVYRLFMGGYTPRCLYFCEALFSPEAKEKAYNFPQHIAINTLSVAAFHKISHRENPDGVMALMDTIQPDLNTLSLKPEMVLLILEGLEKPGNVGALLRTADGAGADAVVLVGEGIELFNPNVIRASQGSVFTGRVYTSTSEALQRFLKTQHFGIVAATPHADQSFWDTKIPSRVAIVLGTEHEGLSPEWLQRADVQVHIPMLGQADSLNVATAGALLLYEVQRQRKE